MNTLYTTTEVTGEARLYLFRGIGAAAAQPRATFTADSGVGVDKMRHDPFPTVQVIPQCNVRA